jgi:hypothetical protein
MRKTKTGLTVAACLAASVAIVPATFGQTEEIIYDNTSGPLGFRTSQQNAEIGDVVTFGGSSLDRLLTEFAFEYFMTPGSGNEMAQVFIRSVEAGTVNPDAIIFQTAPFAITSGNSGGYNTVRIPGLLTLMPETVAWTVQFSGFEGAEEAGLLFYNPPTVGSSPTFNGTQFTIQRNSDSSFSILDTPGVADNLSARFTAVPEPSTLALLVGGLAGFGLLRRRKA